MKTLLTVGLPVYNSMPYLPEAIESLLSQSFRDFKILAVVQNCNDGSIEYLQSVQDPRLRLIYESKPSLIRALNRMLAEADTPWIVRQDSDDISYPRRFEAIFNNIEIYPDAGMFYSLAEYFPPNRAVGTFRCSRGAPEELRRFVKDGYLLSMCHSSVVLNVEKVLSVGGYRETARLAEDADLWWRMALKYDIRMMPEKLVGYRHHGAQLTTNKSRLQALTVRYVQYLLLSHLWSLKPQSWEQALPVLDSLAPTTDSQAKAMLRMINVSLSNKNYTGAIKSALASLVLSPRYLMRRVRDEVIPHGRIVDGIDPGVFLSRKDDLWPTDRRGTHEH